MIALAKVDFERLYMMQFHLSKILETATPGDGE